MSIRERVGYMGLGKVEGQLEWGVGSGKWLVGERDLSGKLFDWGIWSKKLR